MSKLFSVLNTYKATILNHITNTSNPHSVTNSNLGINSYVTQKYLPHPTQPAYWEYRIWEDGRVEMTTTQTLTVTCTNAWGKLYYYHPSTVSTSTNVALSAVDWVRITVKNTTNYWVPAVDWTIDATTHRAAIDYYILAAKSYTNSGVQVCVSVSGRIAS